MRNLIDPIRMFLCLAGVLLAGVAEAGWLTVKNDTRMALQLNDPAGRARPVTLQPGETYRSFQTNPGNMSFNITSTQAPKVILQTARFQWGKDDIQYTIRPDGRSIRVDQP